MINRSLNISAGIIGGFYILVDIVFRLTAWILMHSKKISYPFAFRLADNRGVFFIVVLFLSFILSLISLVALVSNLILFVRADFFLRVLFTMSGVFLPFIPGETTFSLFFEVFFIGLYVLYLYKIKHRKRDISESEFENYKQL